MEKGVDLYSSTKIQFSKNTGSTKYVWNSPVVLKLQPDNWIMHAVITGTHWHAMKFTGTQKNECNDPAFSTELTLTGTNHICFMIWGCLFITPNATYKTKQGRFHTHNSSAHLLKHPYNSYYLKTDITLKNAATWSFKFSCRV